MTRLDNYLTGAPGYAARWKYLLLLVISIGIVYAQSLQFDFVTYDDYELVVQNGDFLSRISNVVTSFTTHVFTTHRAESGYYRPILLISYIFDYQLWGLNPFGYHLTNFLLHGCTAVIVFLFIERLVKNQFAALLGSMLFALHPLQTESVAWVAGRNDVLLGFFVTVMLLSYLYYRENVGSKRLYLIVSVVAFTFALFTKESAAFYLLLIPLLEICVEKKKASKEGFLNILPFLGVVVVYLIARWSVIGELIGAERMYGTLPLVDRLRQVPAIISEHCALVVLPMQLSIVHPLEQLRWFVSPWTIVALMIPSFLLVAAWYCWRKDGVLCFGMLCFLAGLVPVLGIFPVAVPILEHRLYLPLVGVTIVAARIVSLISVPKLRSVVTVMLGLVVIVLAFASYVRLPVWRDSTTLWMDAIEKAPTVSRSYFNLAGYYFEHQQYDSTARLLKKYIELKPDDFLGYSKLRQTYFLAGRYEDAGLVNRQIIAHNPSNPNRYLEAGMMYEQLQRYDSAVALYNEGLRVDSNVFDLHYHLAMIHQQMNDTQVAEFHFKRAVEIAPRDSRGLFSLGVFYAGQHDNLPAIEMIQRGMNAGTPTLEIVKLLHELYMRMGQQEQARQLAERYHF
jgi:Tfp pilus assembly protein PilF